MRAHHSLPSAQGGAILLLTLFAMLILMVSSIAMLRSFDTSVLMSGGYAFKRDLVNEGELGIAHAVAAFKRGGALEVGSDREADNGAINYSASILPSNSRGIPEALLSDSGFAAAGMREADIHENGVTIRTVIDRQCSPGTAAFGTATCSYVSGHSDAGGTSWLKRTGSGSQPIYRISVRVNGPHNTQVFLQTTMAR